MWRDEHAALFFDVGDDVVASWVWIFAPSSNDSPRDASGRIVRAGGEDPSAVRTSRTFEIDGISGNDWVTRIRTGDPNALAAVYRALRAKLWRFAVTLTGDDARAHDIVHDVFMALWARRDTLVVRDALDVYLFSAVRYRVSKLRRHHAVVRRFAESVMAVPDRELGENPVLSDASAEADEMRRAIHLAIETLPPRDRAALMLRWSEERTYEEIGRVLGVTAMGAHKMVIRALNRVRPLLEGVRNE
jgi:RNA polymerase sigma factor (sigma-70 family)